MTVHAKGYCHVQEVRHLPRIAAHPLFNIIYIMRNFGGVVQGVKPASSATDSIEPLQNDLQSRFVFACRE